MRFPKTIPPLENVLNSSNIRAIGYDFLNEYLYVQFLPSKDSKYGRMYRYKQVPVAIWVHLRLSSSKGEFLFKKIKGFFDYSKWTGVGWRKQRALQSATRARRARRARWRSSKNSLKGRKK